MQEDTAMKAILRSVVGGLLALVLTAAEAFAQERPAFSPQELDQMLAPIALYPDPLLSQILMSATYPLEVVQAARWSRANRHLQGQDAVRAVESMDWDPSVKSLVAFPQILHRMDEQLEWTQRLGEAFLEQEPHVMDAIQGLRQKAAAAGTLRSDEQMRVSRQDGNILIEPARPQVVYVPYYDPAVVYGPWWWPAYPPVYWGPPPGYYAWPAYAPGFFWGTGIAVSWGFFFGHADWHHRHVKVVHVNHYQHAHRVPVKWQHDPVHRRNVPYRYTASRQPFGQHPGVRGDDRGRPDARHDTRGGQPQVRNAAPQTRTAPAAPNPRPERFTPQPGDRWTERNPRMETPRPRANFAAPPVGAIPRQSSSAPVGTVSRPNASAPVGTVPRPSSSAPIARAEPRPHPPATQARPAPRQQVEPARRAEPRQPARDFSAVPRPSVSGPIHVPRFDGNPSHGGGARPQAGGGHPRGGSAGASNGRRS
jgi:hypothetical protein